MSGSAPTESANRIDRGLAVAAVTGVVLLSFAACFRRIWAADFWWQYAAGRLVAESGWPSTDVFSFTATGAPWVELRWLFCWVQYRVMTVAGPEALVVLKWLAVVAAFTAVSLPVARRKNVVALSITLTIALLASSQRFFVRPELATYAFFGLYVWLLHRHRRSGGRLIFILPLVQVLWVNSHPLFILGPLLVGLLLFVETVRAWVAGADERPQVVRGLLPVGLVLLGTVLAGFVNPYGVDGFLLPFRLFGEMQGSIFKEAITELKSPFSFAGTYLAVHYYKLLILLCGLSALANIRRLDPFGSLLCASQLYLSALAIRSLPLFCLAAVPFIVDNLEHTPLAARIDAATRRTGGRLLAVASTLLCLWFSIEMFTDRFNLKQNDSNQFGAGIARHRYPVRAADFLESAGRKGRVLGGLLESSYLLSRGHEVFADPRLEVYGEEIFERFLSVTTDAGAFAAAVREFDIPLVVAGPTSPLLAFVGPSPDWKLVYLDETATVYLRGDHLQGLEPLDSAAEFRRLAEKRRAELGPPVPYEVAGFFHRVSLPKPYLMLADFFLLTGQANLAEQFLDDATTASPFLPRIAHRRASLAELRGDTDAALEYRLQALEETPDEPRLTFRLAEAYLRRDEPERARPLLERTLELEPERAITWALLGRVHLAAQELAAAETALSRAAELAPANATHVANLARLHARQGRVVEAIDGLESASGIDPLDSTILRDVAALYLQRGNLAAAADRIRRALALTPGDPDLLRLREVLESAGPQP